MNRAGDHSFSRSAFALNQHRPAAARGLPDRIGQIRHRGAYANQVFQPDRFLFHAAGLWIEV